jgi:hypothetical protein
VRYHTFNFEIKDLITQFMSAFDESIVKRYNRDRKPTKSFNPRYVYAHKQRVVHDIINKSQHIQLPVVAISIDSVARDPGRVFNKIDGFHFPRSYEINSNGSQHDVVPPVNPVNIEVSMSILTKYQNDLDQIITNFAPYTNPYIILSWRIPQAERSLDPFIAKDAPIQELRSEVLWNGTINMNYPKDLSADTPYRVSADTGFTIKGWLFTKPPENGIGTIFDIESNFVTVEDLDDITGGNLDNLNTTNNTPANE